MYHIRNNYLNLYMTHLEFNVVDNHKKSTFYSKSLSRSVQLLLVPLTYRWIVQRCIEHNDGEAEHIAGVRVGKDIRIELAITLRKTLHHAIDLLRLTRQAK